MTRFFNPQVWLSLDLMPTKVRSAILLYINRWVSWDQLCYITSVADWGRITHIILHPYFDIIKDHRSIFTQILVLSHAVQIRLSMVSIFFEICFYLMQRGFHIWKFLPTERLHFLLTKMVCLIIFTVMHSQIFDPDKSFFYQINNFRISICPCLGAQMH